MKSNRIEIAKLVEGAVDKGATTAEEIHRSIADLPISILPSLGVTEEASKEAKDIQDKTIGAIYELVRDINHEVAGLARDIINKVEIVEQESKKEEA